MPSPSTTKTTQSGYSVTLVGGSHQEFSAPHAMTMFYHQEAPVLAVTQCNAENCRREGGCRPKPGDSHARRGQRRARVKPGEHRGGRKGGREAPTNNRGWVAGLCRLRNGGVVAAVTNINQFSLK